MLPSERNRMLAERIIEDIEVVNRQMDHFALTEEMFCNDHSFAGELAYDALMNPVYRIVEDACHLSDSFSGAYLEFAWREMKGFRNFIAHAYGSVNRAIAWDVITLRLPELHRLLLDRLV